MDNVPEIDIIRAEQLGLRKRQKVSYSELHVIGTAEESHKHKLIKPKAIVPLADIDRRSSSRTTTKVNYTDLFSDRDSDELTSESDLNTSSSDDEGTVDYTKQVETIPEDPFIELPLFIDKILGHRIKELENDNNNAEMEEYLIKWKRKAYIHNTWETKHKILSISNGRTLLRNYLKKITSFNYSSIINNNLFSSSDSEEYFNNDYLIVDRIVTIAQLFPNSNDSNISKLSDTADWTCPACTFLNTSDNARCGVCNCLKSASNKISENNDISPTPLKVKYLVKWKSLPYEEVTWEDYDDIKDFQQAIDFYYTDLNKIGKPVSKKMIKPFSKFEKLDFNNDNELRNYQLEGANWLAYNWSQSRNNILADEMGLGKTIQVIAFLQYLAQEQTIHGPFLIVAPLSTLPHWQREIENWTNFNSILYHGSALSRQIIHDYEFFHISKNNTILKNSYKFDIVITSYETILNTQSKGKQNFLRNIDWRALIIDEAHRIKNRNSKLFEAARALKFSYCCMLTGTPLQNNLTELWTLLYFLSPKEFPDSDSFEKKYSSENGVIELRDNLLPLYLLRREKIHVETSLPSKEETVIFVELTKLQKNYYKAIYEKNIDFLMPRKGTRKGIPSLMNICMQLRKCCNHPYTLGVHEYNPLEEPQKLISNLIYASGKFILMDKLFPKLYSQGHRVLLFSQMIKVLDLIEEYIQLKGYKFVRLDGRITGPKRQKAIDDFSREGSDIFVFLLCTRAGGLGINLTAADTVIIFDSDWNPQNDIQAQSRCHRIGQEKEVKIYRLITRNTYEAEMFGRASLKLGLDRAVLHNISMDNDGSTKDSKQDSKEIERLLKHGAYAFHDDDEQKLNEFCENDIDSIMAKSTKTIKYNHASDSSTFSKAHFVPSNTEHDVSVDDPNFWNKMGLQQVDEIETNLIYAPRLSKPVERLIMQYREVTKDKEPEDEFKTLKTSWNRKDISSFVDSLITFGYGRWELIRTECDFDSSSYSDSSLKSFAIGFIYHCALNCNFESGSVILTSAKLFQDVIELLPSSDPSYQSKYITQLLPKLLFDPIFGSKYIQKKLQKRSKRYLERLDRLQIVLEAAEIELNQHLNTELQGVDEAPSIKLLCSNFKISSDFQQISPWWNEKSDRALILGTFFHGWEKYDDMKHDPKLNFELPSSTEEYIFPPNSLLRKRLRVLTSLLMKHIKKRRQDYTITFSKKQSKKKTPEQIIKDAEKEERKALKWSYKEVKAFPRAVLAFPIVFEEASPDDWKEFRTKAGLNPLKPVELIQQTYIEYLNNCTDTLEKEKDHDKMEIEEIQANTNKKTKEKKSAKDNDSNEDSLVHVKSSIIARKVLNRITLWKSLLKALRNENFHNILFSKIMKNEKSIKLGSWWKPGINDEALLKGIFKHGFGNWDEMKKDVSLDIFKNMPKAPELIKIKTSKEKSKNTKKDIPKEYIYPREPLFENRVIYLCKEINQEDVPILQANVRQKGIKRNSATSYVKEIRRDEKGNIIFPIGPIKHVTIFSLGTIEHKRDSFHNENYIWPVGFSSKRTHPSYLNPDRSITYTSEIIDDGQKPSFKVTAEDDLKNPIIQSSASAAWKTVLERIRDRKLEKRKEKKTTENQKPIRVSGPEFFGYLSPIIAKCIQELPNADKCLGYIIHDFEKEASAKRAKRTEKTQTRKKRIPSEKEKPKEVIQESESESEEESSVESESENGSESEESESEDEVKKQPTLKKIKREDNPSDEQKNVSDELKRKESQTKQSEVPVEKTDKPQRQEPPKKIQNIHARVIPKKSLQTKLGIGHSNAPPLSVFPFVHGSN